ncbi:MAG: cytochrome c oxidase accessory protein CcoG [Gammaproteobacteria bacterium]|nr:cytochrome c oxidase accessory protein CcoG [Gammaproteobacteria bacterium]
MTSASIIQTPIIPRSVRGHYRTIKYLILFFAYGIYFSLPWLPWQRAHGPNQAILFDIINRKFYIFDLVVYAQDIFWLAGFLIIAALLLFFVTGIAGRVFCGYFCFQTLWTDVFLLIEQWVQGERNARIKLACGPWGLTKFFKLSLTWVLWLGVAWLTGFSFVLYWGEAPRLFVDFFHGAAPFPAYATTVFLTTSTFVMAGLAREQVCTYMCPYARFQSAMVDQHTVVVAYDSIRGEGARGRHKPDKNFLTREQREQKGHGDCIDCGYCVQVCPAGIDIRNGLQYQCISCALCIDACNSIMSATGFPRGLIRYSAQQPTRTPAWRRPKTVGYGAVLSLASAWLIWSISTRTPVELQLEQIRQPLFVVLADGRVQNHYTLKVNNKTALAASYRIDLQGMNADWEARPQRDVRLGPEQSVLVDVLVRMPAEHPVTGRQEFTMTITGEGQLQDVMKHHTVNFFWPGGG